MSTRAEEFAHASLPTPLRWLGAAAAVAATLAVIQNLRERARRPKVPPMSPDWLQHHLADREYHSYD